MRSGGAVAVVAAGPSRSCRVPVAVTSAQGAIAARGELHVDGAGAGCGHRVAARGSSCVRRSSSCRVPRQRVGVATQRSRTGSERRRRGRPLAVDGQFAARHGRPPGAGRGSVTPATSRQPFGGPEHAPVVGNEAAELLRRDPERPDAAVGVEHVQAVVLDEHEDVRPRTRGRGRWRACAGREPGPAAERDVVDAGERVLRQRHAAVRSQRVLLDRLGEDRRRRAGRPSAIRRRRARRRSRLVLTGGVGARPRGRGEDRARGKLQVTWVGIADDHGVARERAAELAREQALALELMPVRGTKPSARSVIGRSVAHGPSSGPETTWAAAISLLSVSSVIVIAARCAEATRRLLGTESRGAS